MTDPSRDHDIQYVELRRLPADLDPGPPYPHHLHRSTSPARGTPRPRERPGEAPPEWLEQVLHEQAAMLGPTQALPALLPDISGPKGIGFYHAWLDNESERHTSYYFKLAWRGFAGKYAVPCARRE